MAVKGEIPMLQSREKANMRLFLAGKAVSLTGSILYTFAAGWYVLRLTGSAASFGLTLALGIMPMVLMLPIAGVMADRMNRKRLVVGMDVLNGLLFLGLGAFVSVWGLSLTAVYVTTVLTTLLTTVFSVSLEASKMELVSKSRLMKLSASSRVLESVIAISGPVLGGLVYSLVGIQFFLWINGVSFLVSALSESFMSFRSDHDMSPNMMGESEQNSILGQTHKGILADLRQGIAVLLSEPGLKSLAWRLMAINFFLGFCVNVPVPYVISHHLIQGAGVLGVVQSGTPVGVILGALMIARLNWSVQRAMRAAGIALAVSLVLIGAMLALVTSALNLAVLVGLWAAMILLGIGIAWIDLPLLNYFQVAVPEHLKGRVLSVVMSLAKLALPAALLSAGMLVEIMPAWILPALGSVFYLGSLFLGGHQLPDVSVEALKDSM
jgi:hypothetical protein